MVVLLLVNQVVMAVAVAVAPELLVMVKEMEERQDLEVMD
jgi:hypothetical protein